MVRTGLGAAVMLTALLGSAVPAGARNDEASAEAAAAAATTCSRPVALPAATPLTAGTPATGSISAGAAAYYSFAAAAGSRFRVAVTLGSLTDSVLTLYGVDPTNPSQLCQLAMDDDSGAGYGSALTWIAGTAATYYVKVTAYSSNDRGSFTLTAATLDSVSCLSGGESAHPYADSSAQTFIVTNPNGSAASTRLHLYMATEAQYDFVEVRDGSNRLVQRLNGKAMDGRWTRPVPGTTVKLVLISDVNLNGYGLCVDQVDSNAGSATGQAMVYSPSPAGGGFQDNNDADSAGLTAARTAVSLQGLDGSGHLAGPYVDLTGNGIGDNYRASGQAYDPAGSYSYTRSDARFEEAQIYYHLDSVQRYLQSLGFVALAGRPTAVSAHWDDFCNAFYDPFDRALHFGDCDDASQRGGVLSGADFGEDGTVAVHEYGHAVLDSIVPGISTREGAALHEAFADYLAATTFDTPCMGQWVMVSGCLRSLANENHYPEAISDDPHITGEIWSGALWDLRAALGKTAADKLIIEGLYYGLTPTGASFRQAAQGLIDADSFLNGGTHVPLIHSIMSARGIPLLAADTNADCRVDVRDFSALLLAYGRQYTASGWDPRIDVNGDGVVDAADYSALAAAFGTRCE